MSLFIPIIACSAISNPINQLLFTRFERSLTPSTSASDITSSTPPQSEPISASNPNLETDHPIQPRLHYSFYTQIKGCLTHAELDIDEERIDVGGIIRNSLCRRPSDPRHRRPVRTDGGGRTYIRIPIECTEENLKKIKKFIDDRHQLLVTTCSHATTTLLNRYTNISVPYPINLSPTCTTIFLIGKRYLDIQQRGHSPIGVPERSQGNATWTRVLCRPEIYGDLLCMYVGFTALLSFLVFLTSYFME